MINYQVVQDGNQKYVACLADSGQMVSEQDALDLVAACGEAGTDRLLLHAENLTADFYNLKTGLAGVVLLKFANYRIKAAAILTPELVGQGRFREMVLESNRGEQFRVFYSPTEAHAWLTRP